MNGWRSQAVEKGMPRARVKPRSFLLVFPYRAKTNAKTGFSFLTQNPLRWGFSGKRSNAEVCEPFSR